MKEKTLFQKILRMIDNLTYLWTYVFVISQTHTY